MKVEFWKHQTEVLLIWPFAIIISALFTIIGLILMFVIDTSLGGMAFCGAICLILALAGIFANNRVLSKVKYSDSGILLKRFKKEILFLTWDEINEVTTTPVSRSITYLSFVSNKGKIDVELTKKMYEAIMKLCPNINVKTQINDIERFKGFHK